MQVVDNEQTLLAQQIQLQYFLTSKQSHGILHLSRPDTGPTAICLRVQGSARQIQYDYEGKEPHWKWPLLHPACTICSRNPISRLGEEENEA